MLQSFLFFANDGLSSAAWNQPEKFEYGATDTLTEFLKEIRSRGVRGKPVK